MGDAPSNRIDQFLLLHSARADHWRSLTILAEDWAERRGNRQAVEAAVEGLAPVESFHAYPGPVLFGALRERIASDDAAGASKLGTPDLQCAADTLVSRAGQASGTPPTKSAPRKSQTCSRRRLARDLRVSPISRFCSSTASRRRAGPLWPPNGAGYDDRRMRLSMSRSSSDRSRTRSARRRSIPLSAPSSWLRASPTVRATTRRSSGRSWTRSASPRAATLRRCGWPRR